MFNARNKKIMDTNVARQLKLHWDILPKATRKALDFFATQNWLKNANWYLAGGTALALQERTRRSVDLDFFTEQRDFDNTELLNNFVGISDWRVTINKKNTIYGELFGAKVSFIVNPFFIPKQKMIKYGSVQILGPVDIAVMKIVAISQRGRKRDFFDLYWCARNIGTLNDFLRKLKDQYPLVAHNYHHILKSLVYFEDAERDPEPEIYFTATWKEVKNFFNSEIPKIMKKIIES